MADQPAVMVAFRMQRSFIRRIDVVARIHGWTRTTYVIRAISRAVEADEAVYAATPEQIAADVENRKKAVVRTQRWRTDPRRHPDGPGRTDRL